MLSGIDLACVRGERRIFAGVSFRLDAGELLQVSGPNGSGKSSLLRMLCGLLPPAAGDIRWHGRPVRALGRSYVAELAYLAHLNGVKEELSDLENLEMHCGIAGERREPRYLAGVLARVAGLAGGGAIPLRWLSQGQKRRVALARLAATPRKLWLLDEPFAALDEAAVELARRAMETHLRQGGLAVVTSHQDLALTTGRVQRIRLDG